MNKTKCITILWLFIFMVGLLAGCRSRAQLQSTPLKTVTLVVSRTLAPSSTPSRTTRPTTTPWPFSTSTPRPTATATLIESTPIPWVYETTTPIATPAELYRNYGLKPWSEQDALDLVNQMQEYSYAVNIPRPAGDLRIDYQDAQFPIKIAVREALLRFPDIGSKEILAWRLALANAFLDQNASDGWILSQIENGLNSGIFTPATLSLYLSNYGFRQIQETPAPNLFGDGKNASIVQISTLESNFSGLYFILTETADQKYSVMPFLSHWNFNFSGDGGVEVGDHTRDGIPEAVYTYGTHNGTMCNTRVLIFQWNGDHFVDLGRAPGRPEGIVLGECGYEWLFKKSNQTNSDAFEIHWSVEKEASQIFQWNGRWFEEDTSRYQNTSLGTSGYILDYVESLLEKGDYETELAWLERVIKTPSKSLKEDFGPSFIDFLRFKLAVAHSLRSDPERAREVLTDLINRPYNPRVTALSHAAKTFLNTYQKSTDLYRACHNSMEYLDNLVTPYREPPKFPGSEGYVSDEKMIEEWGYRGQEWRLRPLCSLRLAAQEVLNQSSFTNFDQALDVLQKAGVKVGPFVKLDLNNDGIEDGVLAVNTTPDITSLDLWAVVMTEDGARILPILDYDTKGDIPSTYGLSSKPLEAQAIQLPDSDTPGIILRAGQSLHSFRIWMRADQPEIENLTTDSFDLYFYNRILSFDVRQFNRGPELVIGYIPEDCLDCQDIFTWDRSIQVFIKTNETNVNQNAVRFLFDEKDFPKTITYISKILARPVAEFEEYDFTRSYLWYLLGLAYELNGEEQKAVNSYWHVWHDFPESSFARMAQSKIEAVGP